MHHTLSSYIIIQYAWVVLEYIPLLYDMYHVDDYFVKDQYVVNSVEYSVAVRNELTKEHTSMSLMFPWMHH